ncbi:hypothetical protein JX265_007255 [Neoarthrinium moseri]|uniref:Uncharacterized protein n=1 Tax=Neoarthrinium moseri TaxID=1658444 RepID=A0A9Q0APS3_9PEZI|nr:hypothetical protein JX266_003595 [Neoarthrinium moseri]KAI1867453.1 hypothetical protein JX265_007255 [Neoarthrinium moseri]
MASPQRVRKTLALLGLYCLVCAAIDCKSVYIQSQGDADALQSCETIAGSVTISKSYRGDLTLPGVKSIQGSLTTEPCQSDSSTDTSDWQTDPPDFRNLVLNNCSGLAHFVAPDLNQVSQDVVLIAQLNLTSVTLPKLKWVGTTFSLDGMPELASVSVPSLLGFGRFNLFYTPKLQNLEVPQHQAQSLGSISIGYTGLDDLGSLFLWSTRYDSVALSGLSNASQLYINTTGTFRSLDITGNGLLAVHATQSGVTVGSLSVAGAGSLTTQPWNVASFSAVGNTFSRLDITAIQGIENLDVRDNAYMELLGLPQGQNWTNVAITGNPVLDPGSAVGHFDITTFLGATGSASAAQFPSASSFEFEGPFRTEFL